MQIKKLLPAAACVAVAAAQDNMPMNLTATLSSTPELSQLLEVLGGFEQFASMLASNQNVTILAPSNEAFDSFANGPTGALLNDTEAVQFALSYHVLNGTYMAENITETPTFIPTSLNDETLTQVTGGQVVKAMTMGDNVTFYSGLMTKSTVVQADVMYDNGVVHIIDQLLAFPVNVSVTAIATNNTALYGALVKADLVDDVNTMEDLTIFAPNNEAFQSIGSTVANLSAQELGDTLGYHVVQGPVGYSSTLMNGTSLQTLGGSNVTITVEDSGDIYVNSAKVVLSDVLVSNGVVHVIDNVLNPSNATAAPDTEQSTQMPAFSDASSATEVPFTSDVPTPTSVIATETETVTPASGETTSSSEDAGLPMKTGAMGMAALFGGAAAVYNM